MGLFSGSATSVACVISSLPYVLLFMNMFGFINITWETTLLFLSVYSINAKKSS